MQKEGIEFRLNAHIGKDLSAKVSNIIESIIIADLYFTPYFCQELYDEFDAIVLAMGATWPRDLR